MKHESEKPKHLIILGLENAIGTELLIQGVAKGRAKEVAETIALKIYTQFLEVEYAALEALKAKKND